MEQRQVRQMFTAEVQRADADINLARASLLIAQEEYLDLDIPQYLAKLDAMGQELASRLGGETRPRAVIEIINRYLFTEQGFQGNETDYYDPANEFLSYVLDHRMGIPTTLSVLYLEMARQVNFPLAGVALPGRFVVKYQGPEDEIFIDPYGKGTIVTRQDCQRVMEEVFQDVVSWQDWFLDPVGNKKVLKRMLNNLKGSYFKLNDLPRALAAVERILLVDPEAFYEVRNRGYLRLQLGDTRPGLLDLEQYLRLVPNASDASTIRMVIGKAWGFFGGGN